MFILIHLLSFCLIFLGLRSQDGSSEMLWRETIAEVMSGTPEENRMASWPILLFLSILFATPYLIHRLVNNAKNTSVNGNLKETYPINYYYLIT